MIFERGSDDRKLGRFRLNFYKIRNFSLIFKIL